MGKNAHTVEKRVDERASELAKINGYLRLLMDHPTNMFVLFDRDMNMLCCSNSVLDLLGLKPDEYGEIINKPLSKTHDIHPDQEYAKRSSQRFSLILSGEDLIVTDDVINWPGRGILLFHITYRRILDHSGNFDGIVLTLLDVTEVRMEEAKRRMSDMLNSPQTACFVWDETGRIVAYNKVSAHIFGLPDDISPERFNDLYASIQPEFQPNGIVTETVRLDLLREALEKGFAQVTGRLAKVDGTPIHVSVTVTRIVWLSGYRLIVYHFDTTGLMEKEQQIRESAEREREADIKREAAQAASQAKSRFLANMSHEIRTPMNSIMGFSELAMEEAVSPKTKEYLGKIMENSRGLLQIINDILDISKIESGNIELENIPFDLHELLATCKGVILPKAIEKNIELDFYAEPPIGKKLYGDPTKLRQVLLNLLSNAVKFTESGKVSLFTGVKNLTEDAATLRFEVKDTGIGMTEGQIARVFEPFMQADVSMTRKYGGTGLGLAITKNILDLMDSGLEIESASGAGTKIGFTVTIRTTNETDEAPENDDAITAPEKPMFGGEVLVCEDNRMNQQVIIEHLTRIGLNAVIAENGQEGINKVKHRIDNGEKPYDVIFMDIHMPVMDGIEATPKIIALGSGTPIIAMTANVMTEDRDLYKALGMSGYVGKPFTSQELWRCLLKYLTPLSVSPVDKVAQTRDNSSLQKKLETHFVRNNQNKFRDITGAIDTGDIKLARRLVHTLKGNAGMIGKTGLQNAAEEIEALLKEGKPPMVSGQMSRLEAELNSVLEELQPLLAETAAQPESLTAEQTLTLYERLGPMLENINPGCVDLLSEIRAVPGTEELVRQIENYDFETAALTLAKIKQNKVW